MRQKKVYGFSTGDMVKAIIPKGKKKGVCVGKVAVRKTGSFNLQNLRPNHTRYFLSLLQINYTLGWLFLQLEKLSNSSSG